MDELAPLSSGQHDDDIIFVAIPGYPLIAFHATILEQFRRRLILSGVIKQANFMSHWNFVVPSLAEH